MDLLFNISHICKSRSGKGLRRGPAFTLKCQAFSISSEDNEFVTVGCDTYGYLHSFHNRTKSSTGCLTRCVSKESVESIQRHGIQIKHSALKISITPPTSTTAALPLLSKREPTISRWIIYATSPSWTLTLSLIGKLEATNVKFPRRVLAMRAGIKIAIVRTREMATYANVMQATRETHTTRMVA